MSSDREVWPKVSRECITCDAEGCNEANPRTRCSTCKLVYYCGKECATKHWVMHKPDCRSVESMRSYMAMIPGGEIATNTAATTTSNATATATDQDDEPCEHYSSCGICLTEKMTNPFVLEGCQHVFCFACVLQYQKMAPQTSGTAATCPYCRSEMKDIKQATESRAALHAARAAAPRASHEERIEQCNLAWMELEKLLDMNHDESSSSASNNRWSSGPITTRILRAEVLDIMGEHKQALNVLEQLFDELLEGAKRAKKVDELMAEAKEYLDSEEDQALLCESLLEEVEAVASSGILVSASDLVDTTLKIAAVQQKLQDWTAVKELYRFLIKDYMYQDARLTPPQERQVFMGISRVAYEEGDYDNAIQFGEGAIEMNRHFPGAHHYVALSHFKKGDIEEARKIMSRAMLYETPWCDTNRASVRKVWEEVMKDRCE
eukprot:scaffold134962_cov49-Attheya_sp.AAC.2